MKTPKAKIEQPRNPWMIDVARLAGVSHQIVSRVLNGNPNVRPELVERSQQAIQQLGFRRARFVAQLLPVSPSVHLALAAPAVPPSQVSSIILGAPAVRYRIYPPRADGILTAQ